MLEKKQCCGCRACEQICPKGCIEMIEDKEGFLYPKINKEKCIECGLCKKICPMINNEKIKQKEEKKVYRMTTNNKELIRNSSSGGAFSLIAEEIIENNTNKKYKIYGCALEEDLVARHKGVDNIEKISIFRKSKYVQSDLQNIYSNIQKELKEGKNVIFTGTPCQVAGLVNFVGKENTKNLYTIDLICHGVPSPMVFNKYLKYLERKNKTEIKSFNFREKLKLINIIDSLGINVELKNDKIIKEYSFNNLYMLGFFKGLYYRPCCEFCPFANIDRVSDITIGDFWGINKKYKNLNPHEGISLCMVNSQKGQNIIKGLSERVNIVKEESELAVENNKNLSKPSVFSLDRQKFFDELIKTDNFGETIKLFVKKKSKLRFWLTSNLDDNLKDKIKRLIKK